MKEELAAEAELKQAYPVLFEIGQCLQQKGYCESVGDLVFKQNIFNPTVTGKRHCQNLGFSFEATDCGEFGFGASIRIKDDEAEKTILLESDPEPDKVQFITSPYLLEINPKVQIFTLPNPGSYQRRIKIARSLTEEGRPTYSLAFATDLSGGGGQSGTYWYEDLTVEEDMLVDRKERIAAVPNPFLSLSKELDRLGIDIEEQYYPAVIPDLNKDLSVWLDFFASIKAVGEKLYDHFRKEQSKNK
jgi:hypothetical protein